MPNPPSLFSLAIPSIAAACFSLSIPDASGSSNNCIVRATFSKNVSLIPLADTSYGPCPKSFIPRTVSSLVNGGSSVTVLTEPDE